MPEPGQLGFQIEAERAGYQDPAAHMNANAKYAQYLVDSLGEQQAFQVLKSRGVQLPRGWVPDAARALQFQTAKRQDRLADETIRAHQANETRLNAAEQRQAATAKATENRPRWKLTADDEGREFYVDETGKHPPRPLLLPSTGGGERQSVRMKDLAATELDSLRDNAQQVAQVVKALGMMRGEQVEGQQGDTEATGLKGFLPAFALQRIDTAGVPTRAVVGNVGSLRIKQRSGGAVPAAEMARLKPFVPDDTDAPETVREKLALFASEYAKMLEEDVGAFKAANRRVPVALENYVKERAGMARGVMSGRMKADQALGGQPDPAALMQAIQAELARRGGG